jgi:transposase
LLPAATLRAERLDAFFDALGPDGVAALELVSIDMSGAFKKALRRAGAARRHRLRSLPCPALGPRRPRRGSSIAGQPGAKPEAKKALKKTRFTLQRAPWKLDAVARRKLTELEAENHPLYQAYLMKESLVAIFDTATPDDIHDLLMDWLRWIDEEGSPPFQKAANTIAEHFDGVCAYIDTGHTNARAEGNQPKDSCRDLESLRLQERREPHGNDHAVLWWIAHTMASCPATVSPRTC